MTEVLRIANCSGFFGDRLSAAKEMVEGGPIDVLTGDWLAELTMLVLARQRLKHGAGSGYARTFLTQMEQVLGTCLDRGITVVSNAGGLDPEGCAEALQELANRLGLSPSVAYVSGDDLLPRLDELVAAGETLTNLDTGEPFASVGMPALTANAYLGGFGIKAALDAGAQVVVTGRVTDAALVVGPAAHRFRLGARRPRRAGRRGRGGPRHRVRRAGHRGQLRVLRESSRVSSTPASRSPRSRPTAARPSRSTTARAARSRSARSRPSCSTRSVALPTPTPTSRHGSTPSSSSDVGPDRVRVSGVRGEPPPATVKVALNYLGGFSNTMTLVLTGLDIEAKAALAERTLWARVPRETYEHVDVQLVRRDRPDPATAAEAQAQLRITVKDRDPAKVGRAFSNLLVEIGLGTYPGYFPTTMPGDATPYGVYWPTTVAAVHVTQNVVVAGQPLPPIPSTPPATPTPPSTPTRKPHVIMQKWSTGDAAGRPAISA